MKKIISILLTVYSYLVMPTPLTTSTPVAEPHSPDRLIYKLGYPRAMTKMQKTYGMQKHPVFLSSQFSVLSSQLYFLVFHITHTGPVRHIEVKQPIISPIANGSAKVVIDDS